MEAVAASGAPVRDDHSIIEIEINPHAARRRGRRRADSCGR